MTRKHIAREKEAIGVCNPPVLELWQQRPAEPSASFASPAHVLWQWVITVSFHSAHHSEVIEDRSTGVRELDNPRITEYR